MKNRKEYITAIFLLMLDLVDERSAGAVIFRRAADGPKYLILNYPAGHWDFPKGHVEENESEEQTVRREVKEETGISDITIFNGFRKKILYDYRSNGRSVTKQVVFYLAETKLREIHLSWEHKGFTWSPFNQARTKVTFLNARLILESAHDHLQNLDANSLLT